MRNVWRWWKVRKPQIQALLVLGFILFWMSLNLWQTQRHFYNMLRANDQMLSDVETTRKLQLDKLLEAVEAHHAQQDLDVAALRADLWELRSMIGQLIDQPKRQTVR